MTRWLIGIAALLAACSANPDKVERDGDFYYSLAVNNYYEKNAQGALLELESCFKISPDHALGHNLAGLIYMGRRDYGQALKHFESALRADAEFLDARANLGALHIAMQQWQQAVDTLLPLLTESRYGTPYLAENNLGWAYFNLGKLREAEQHLKRALFLNNGMCLAYNNIGLVYVDMKRWDDALDAFEASITRCPDYVDPFFHSAAAYESLGNIGEATKRYTKCEKLGGEGFFGKRCKKKLARIR